MKHTILIGSVLLAFSQYALAEQNPPNLLTFNLTATREVPHDVIQTTNQYIVEGTDPNSVKNKMASALATLKKSFPLESMVRHQNIQVEPVYVNQKIMKWRGTTSVTLESKQIDKLLDWSFSKENTGFQLVHTQYQLSHEKLAEYEEILQKELASMLQQKAKMLTKAYGFTQYIIKEIQFNNSQSPIMYASAVMKLQDGNPQMPPSSTIQQLSLSSQNSIYLSK